MEWAREPILKSLISNDGFVEVGGFKARVKSQVPEETGFPPAVHIFCNFV
jgi:hypothetical protein